MAKAKVVSVRYSGNGPTWHIALTKRRLANLFRAAARNLDARPGMWGKGRLHACCGNSEKFCALGMINHVACVENEYNGITTAAQRAFRFANEQNIITTNDSAYSVDQVTKLMRRAAAYLDHGGSFE
mgnify:FL=1